MKLDSPRRWSKIYRLELTGLALSLAVCCLFVPQVQSFAHRHDAVRQVRLYLPFWKPLEALELHLYDTMFAERGTEIPASRSKFAIVGVDQLSLDSLGEWPFPREWHAQVIRRLERAGAKAIFLDFDFSQRSSLGGDLALAKVLAQYKNVLLLSSYNRETYKSGQRALTYTLVAPLGQSGYDDLYLGPSGKLLPGMSARTVAQYEAYRKLGLDEGTPDRCIASLQPDSDGLWRSYPLTFPFSDGEDNVGSVASLAAGVFQGLVNGADNPGYEAALKSHVWPNLHRVPVPIPLTHAVRPPGGQVQPDSTLIWFWGPPSEGPGGVFPTYSYKDVKGYDVKTALASEHSPLPKPGGAFRSGLGFTDGQAKRCFADRIVFVGATADILKDKFSVPQFQRESGSGAGAQMSGVEIHATVAAMLLDGAYLRAQSTDAALACLFGLSLTSALWTMLLRGLVGRAARRGQLLWARWRGRGKIHGVLWFSLYGIAALLPIVLYGQVAQWLFSQQHLWIEVVYPSLSAATCSAMMLVLLFGNESADRRKAAAQFGRFMAPAILEEVLARPEEDYPRPRRIHATVLFTDLEGFTPYAESLEPEEVVRALNAYMTRMIPVLEAFGGTTDKYIGDAIMAYFGVPLTYPDHAARGLRCAVAMQEECARFREESGTPFYMRIGVHTGMVIAGSMGSEGRGSSLPLLNYTVIGDTVNLASRLEGKNKEFGSWIMCSAATHAAAPGVVRAQSASTQIKGKAETVDVYIVEGLAGEPSGVGNWGPRRGSANSPQTGSEVVEPDLEPGAPPPS